MSHNSIGRHCCSSLSMEVADSEKMNKIDFRRIHNNKIHNACSHYLSLTFVSAADEDEDENGGDDDTAVERARLVRLRWFLRISNV